MGIQEFWLIEKHNVPVPSERCNCDAELEWRMNCTIGKFYFWNISCKKFSSKFFWMLAIYLNRWVLNTSCNRANERICDTVLYQRLPYTYTKKYGYLLSTTPDMPTAKAYTVYYTGVLYYINV